MGRRIGRRKRSDPRGSRRRSRRRASAPRQLHRVFGRRRIALRDHRRSGVGWRERPAEFAPHIEAGTIRALAISSANRLPGLDVPTLREQGVDVEFENWRSVVAPPGVTGEDRRRLELLMEHAWCVLGVARSDALSLAGPISVRPRVQRLCRSEEARVRDPAQIQRRSRQPRHPGERGSISAAGPRRSACDWDRRDFQTRRSSPVPQNQNTSP